MDLDDDREFARHTREFDNREQAERHLAQEHKRQLQVRRAASRPLLYHWIGTIALAVVVATFLGWWIALPGDPPEKDTESQRERSCIANGGGYVPEDLLYTGERGLCVFPGRTVEKEAG